MAKGRGDGTERKPSLKKRIKNAFAQGVRFLMFLACFCMATSGFTPALAAYAATSDTSEETASNVPVQDEDGYYLIGTAEQLEWFAQQVNAQTAPTGQFDAKLTADIDLSGVTYTMIGSTESTNDYSGTFDGQGYTISGQNSASSVFGYVKNATIENVVVSDSTPVAAFSMGGLVAAVTGETTIKNCAATDSVNVTATIRYANAGGLVGQLRGSEAVLHMVNCYSAANVSAQMNAGSLVAGITATSTFQNCLATTASTTGVAIGVSQTTSAASFSNVYFTESATGQYTEGIEGLAFYSDLSATISSLNAYAAENGLTAWSLDGSTVSFAKETVVETPTLKQDEDGTYLIGTAAELDLFSELANSTDNSGSEKTSYSVRLTADIEVDEGFSTISAAEANAFYGTFDGQGHTVSGMSGVMGLIGYTGEATVENLVVSNSTIDVSGQFRRGGIVAVAVGETTFLNCGVTSSVTVTGQMRMHIAGGILGQALNDSAVHFRNCFSQATVNNAAGETSGNNGSFAGSVNGNCTFENCVAATLSNTGNAVPLSSYTGSATFDNFFYPASGSSSQYTEGFEGLTAYTDLAAMVETLNKYASANEGFAYFQLSDDALSFGEISDGTGTWESGSSETTDPTDPVDPEPSEDTGITLKAYDGETVEPAISSDNYYEITNVAELFWYANAVNTHSATTYKARLMNDIVIQEIVLDANGNLNKGTWIEWEPIGKTIVSVNASGSTVRETTYEFGGTFDGQGHTISGVVTYTADKYDALSYDKGLFGQIGPQGVVENVVLADSYINGYSNVGGIAGTNYGTIQNCVNYATVVSDFYKTFSGVDYGVGGTAGGIAGSMSGTSSTAKVSGCVNYGIVSDVSSCTGGIVGKATSASLENCTNYGGVTGAMYTGGVVGSSYSGSSVEGCVNNATVIGSSYTGGIVGSSGSGNNKGTITNSANVGIVKSADGTKGAGVSGAGADDGQNTGCVYLSGAAAYAVKSADTEVTGVDKASTAAEAAYILNQSLGSDAWAAKDGALVPVSETAKAPVAIKLVGTAGEVKDLVYKTIYSDADGYFDVSSADPYQNEFVYEGLYSDADLSTQVAEVTDTSVQLPAVVTLYAKMTYQSGYVPVRPDDEEETPATSTIPEHDAIVTDVSDYEIYTTHYGEWVEQSDGSSIDIQVAKVSLNFENPVTLVSAADLAAELTVKINAAKATCCASTGAAEAATRNDPSNYYYTIDGLSDDGTSLELTVYIGYAIYAGRLTIDCATDGVANLTDDGQNVQLRLDAIVPNGLGTTVVSVTEGTDTTPASTTVNFSALAGDDSLITRAMTHVMLLVNGQPYGDTLNSNWATVETHWHDYQNLTVAKYLQLCVGEDGTSGWLGSNLSKDFTFSADGNNLTITAKTAVAGQIIDLHVSSYLNNGSIAVDTSALASAVSQAKNSTGGLDEATAAELKTLVDHADMMLASAYYSQADVDAQTAAITALLADNPVDGLDLDVAFPTGYSTISTSMGRYPSGMTTFTLTPSADALAEYQKTHEGATAKDMIGDWISNITSVDIDGKTLTSKAFTEYMYDLTTPENDAENMPYYYLSAGTKAATLQLPVYLFDTSSERETDTKTVTIKAAGFATVSGDVTYRNLGATDIQVRVLTAPEGEEGSEVLYSTVLTADEIRALPTYEVTTAAACGMAGLRAFSGQGVGLLDLLNAANVSVGPGMTIKMRTTDQASTNNGSDWTEAAYYNSATFTYKELLGTKRYYYPAMWDDTTVYEELGGKTLYQTLCENGTTYFATDATTAKLLGETKVELDQPILAWNWNEGVVRWDGKNPETVSWNGEKYNYYTSQRGYQFMYGMKATEDGSIAADYTTFANTYGVMGIDIIAGEYTASHVYVEATSADAVAAAVESASANGQTLTVWSGDNQDSPDYSWTFDATGLTGDDAFAYALVWDAETDDDVANIFAQANDAHLISFEHEGDLPATMTLSVKAVGYEPGDELKIFSYDEDAKVFTKEAEGVVVDEDGYVSFEIDHCSLWAASTDDLSAYRVVTGVSMYRLYNPNSGEHFYTASVDEKDGLIAAGWRYEGIGWTAPSSSSTPVYRLYSGTDHHYTVSEAERDNLIAAGWRYEGIGWYSASADTGVALYRQYNPNVQPTAKTNNSGSHNYTTSEAERDNLIAAGWRNEGIGWYGLAD